jgi:Kef-type K+ transport system membrane component KefB
MALDPVLRAIVTICILVFSAKVLGEIFSWRKIPSVLGELLAGILLGPFALGSLIAINGSPLIQINDIVRAFGEIGGILILFVAGLEMTFRDFRKVGTAGFVIGTFGVIVPFIMGYGLSLALGLGTITGLVVGAALVATSISITALVLQEINQSRKVESRMMISAAVVDDVGTRNSGCHCFIHFHLNPHYSIKRDCRNFHVSCIMAYHDSFRSNCSSKNN